MSRLSNVTTLQTDRETRSGTTEMHVAFVGGDTKEYTLQSASNRDASLRDSKMSTLVTSVIDWIHTQLNGWTDRNNTRR